MGHLDPTRTTTTWCLLLWSQRWWEQEWGRRKAIQATRTQMNTKISLSLVTNCLEWFQTWERIWSLVCVLEWSLELLYWMQWLKTWMPWSVVVGGIYSPNHQSGRWGTQPLGFDRWSSDRWDHRIVTVNCPVRLLALLWLCANCPRTGHALFTFCRRPLAQ
jgi:hypothetical protein